MLQKCVTGTRIWTALQRERQVLKRIPTDAYNALEEMCEEVADVIAPRSDLPLNRDNYVVAVIAVLEQLADQGWPRRVLANYPNSRFILSAKHIALDHIDVSVASVRYSLTSLRNAYLFTDKLEGDERTIASGQALEHFMRSYDGARLTKQSLRLWQKGCLTIGTLATTQPSSLIRMEAFTDSPFLLI